jgi:hypothetical protein
MRNKLLSLVLLVVAAQGVWAADSSAVTPDSVSNPDSLVSKPHMGPLGMDDLTGLSLFLTAVLILLLSMFLWRKSLMRRRQQD